MCWRFIILRPRGTTRGSTSQGSTAPHLHSRSAAPPDSARTRRSRAPLLGPDPKYQPVRRTERTEGQRGQRGGSVLPEFSAACCSSAAPFCPVSPPAAPPSASWWPGPMSVSDRLASRAFSIAGCKVWRAGAKVFRASETWLALKLNV